MAAVCVNLHGVTWRGMGVVGARRRRSGAVTWHPLGGFVEVVGGGDVAPLGGFIGIVGRVVGGPWDLRLGPKMGSDWGARQRRQRHT